MCNIIRVHSHTYLVQKVNSQASHHEIKQEREENSPLRYFIPADSVFPSIRGEEEVLLAEEEGDKIEQSSWNTQVLRLSDQSFEARHIYRKEKEERSAF